MSSHSSGRLLVAPASSKGDFDECLATEEECLGSPSGAAPSAPGNSLERAAQIHRINSTGGISDLSSLWSAGRRVNDVRSDNVTQGDASARDRDRSATPDGSSTTNAGARGSVYSGNYGATSYRTTPSGQVAIAIPSRGHEDFLFAETGTVVGVVESGKRITLRTHLCFPSSHTFVSVLCRPPPSLPGGQVPSPHAHPSKDELLIAASGVFPVKTAHMLPVGTYLVPSGFDDGYAVSGPASHPLAFAVVVNNSLDDGQVYARVLDTRSNAMAKCLEYQQLHTYLFYPPGQPGSSPSYRYGPEELCDANGVAGEGPHAGVDGGMLVGPDRALSSQHPQVNDPLLAHGASRMSRTEGLSRAQPMLIFLALVTVLLAGSIVVMVHFLPSHTAPRPYNFLCNITAASQCAAQYGAFEHDCDAAYAGIGDFDALSRCCASSAAYGCFLSSFCNITCPPQLHYGPVACFNLQNSSAWNETGLQQTIIKALRIPARQSSDVSVQFNATGGTATEYPHAKVIFLQKDYHDQGLINLFFHKLVDSKDDLNRALSPRGAPWLESGDPSAGNFLVARVYAEYDYHTAAATGGDRPRPASIADKTDGTAAVPPPPSPPAIGSPGAPLLKPLLRDDNRSSLDGWVEDSADCVAYPCDAAISPLSCYRCKASGVDTTSGIRQNVSLEPFPGTTTYSLYGYYAVPQQAEGEVRVSVRFFDGAGQSVGEATPTSLDPRAVNTFYPQRLPFFWAGESPMGAVLAEINLLTTTELAAARGGDGSVAVESDAPPAPVARRFGGPPDPQPIEPDMSYFEEVVFAPGPPSCEASQPRCNPLRCTSPFNYTHALCIESRSCMKDMHTPYAPGRDATNITQQFVGASFDEVHHKVGANLRGMMHKGSPPPVSVSVYDNNGVPVAYACDNGVCRNNLPPQTGQFQFSFLLWEHQDSVPPNVWAWTIRDNATFCIELGWYVAPREPHHMDIVTKR